MCIYCGTKHYRKIYENHHGSIPRDEDGRSYDIHHIDGDHSNNDPSNLMSVSIQQHYDIHYAQEDWIACHRLGTKMKLSPELLSLLSRLNAKHQIQIGTHPFMRRKDGTSIQTDKITAGTHHFLSGEIQRKEALRLVANGTHRFLDKDAAKERALNQLKSGKHPSQTKKKCKHCGVISSLSNHGRWHGDNCKHKSPS